MGEQQIFNIMIEFFEEDEWDFQWMSGMSVLTMAFSGKNGKWTCFAQAREVQQQFVFYSVLPINVPKNKRQATAEFLTRANYGMIIGNFEMDYDDGEIRYKTSIDVEGEELTPPLIRQVVYSNVVITDRYLPGVMKVIYGDQTPADIIQEIESQEDDDDLGENHDTYDDDEPYEDDDTQPPSPNGSKPH
ncbi:YbjN domain-containing protein [Phototrophicus methaneseepsis]|nr:YbjN domain-containing protein [Phototrophicus methaneseepsis]